MPQLLQYLQLQPVEPDDDSSPLDDYQHDDMIDLTQDVDANELVDSWDHIVQDIELDPENMSDIVE